MNPLTSWIGIHEGVWRTYLRPGELHDESPLHMEITPTDGNDTGISLAYRGSIAGDDVVGTMIVSPTDDGLSIAWTDTWHTAGKQERLVGSGDEDPSYRYGSPDEPWRWSISLDASDSTLTVTHRNTTPTGESAVAVEMLFTR